MKTQKIDIKSVVFNKDNYIRTNDDWRTAHQYKLAMESGDVFPPIIVTKRDKGYILIDGKHRIEANKRLKNKTIEAVVLKPMTDREIYVKSIQLNMAHGLRISVYEKVKIALKLKDMKYNSSQIASLLRTTTTDLKHFVADRMAYSTSGEEIPLKQSVEHYKGSELSLDEEASIDIGNNNLQTGSEQSIVIKELNYLLKNRLINLKDKKVCLELMKLKVLLKKIKFKK